MCGGVGASQKEFKKKEEGGDNNIIASKYQRIKNKN